MSEADVNLSTRSSRTLAQGRPSRLSMEGYIYNANMVLGTALHPNTRQVPVELFEKCKGVVILTIVHAGAFMTLYYGTGVVLSKREDDGGSVSWSAPSSISIGGTTLGAVAGGKRENVLIFIMDDETLIDFAKYPQTRIALDTALTAGKCGGSLNCGMEAPNKGTISVRFNTGVYFGLGLQMATLGMANEQNNEFYTEEEQEEVEDAGKDPDIDEDKRIKAKDILLKKNKVKIPEDTQIPDLYEKLRKLANGETWEPGQEDISRSLQFAQVAQKQSQRFLNTSAK